MLRNRIYYWIKPLLPPAVRMTIRRWFALRQLKRVQNVWPILPGSERLPAGWPGWPEGKQFALVLTHDVEGPSGVAKCRQLMEVELQLGFRSSFNFVPEGEYEVTQELRQDLTRNGFEVGVHDLHHDGKLYHNSRGFSEKSVLINRYLKDWGATGFRSGFMLRNLNWLHKLNVQYEASTFDTDPFEPQPDGVGTIFPFWIPNPNFNPEPSRDQLPTSGLRSPTNGAQRPGYVELPYTLPQDSTLFLLLREQTPAIWLRKLDWVAKHGGMALLNLHPDYVDFSGSDPNGHTYPLDRYRRLLEYVSEKYKGQYWQPLPNELAGWYHQTIAQTVVQGGNKSTEIKKPLKGKRTAVLLYSYYPADPRPRREAEALVGAGMEVDLFCLLEEAGQPAREVINGVQVRRLPIRRRRGGKFTYILQYVTFVGLCFLVFGWRSLRKRYDLVHVHNMPDFLVFGALVAKLRGAEIILDLHDPMPELMMTIFGFSAESKTVRLLKWVEKLSIRFVDRVVTVNLACKRIFAARSCPEEKITVVMNSPDEEIFDFKPCGGEVTRDSTKPFVIMYHGSIVERHGLDLAVQALRLVRKNVPSAELRIYGPRTPFLDSVMASVRDEGMQDSVHYLGAQDLEQIVKSIDGCDLGIIPNRRSVFTEINTPTRIFEYLSRGKPVIAPRVPGIVDYFGDQGLVYFQLGDAVDLARQIEFAYSQSAQLESIVRRGQEVYLGQRWSRKKVEFVSVVSDLLVPDPARH